MYRGELPGLRPLVELLERRRMLDATVILQEIPDQVVDTNSAPTSIDLGERYDDPSFANTLAVFQTVKGNIVVELKDDLVPGIVANFLRYVDADRYEGTIIHRSSSLDRGSGGEFILDPVRVLEGGSVRVEDDHFAPIATFPEVVNDELVDGNNNVVGSLAASNSGSPNGTGSAWFFNVTDNTTPLGNGFNVFGQIRRGLDVMNDIAGLPRVNAGGGLNAVPVVKTPATLEDVVTVGSVSRFAGDFSVTTDNPDLLTPSINGDRLQLNYATNAFGVATVNVNLTLLNGQQVTDSFVVTVNPILMSRDVTLGDGGSKRIVFRDSDGTRTQLTLTKGTGTLGFSGVGIVTQDVRGTTTVEGTDIVLNTAAVGSADGGSLTITTRGGDGRVTIGAMSSTGPMTMISASAMDVSGSVLLGGNVRTIRLGSVNQLDVNGDVRVLTMRDSGVGVSIMGELGTGNFRSIASLVLNSGGRLTAATISGSLTVAGALGLAKVGTVGSDIMAGSATRLTVGDLGGSLAMSGDLTEATFSSIAGNANIAGSSRLLRINNSITGSIVLGQSTRLVRVGTLGGSLSITGAAKTVRIGQAGDQMVSFGGATNRIDLRVDSAMDLSVISSSPLRSLQTDAWSNTDATIDTITAPSIGTIFSRGEFDAALMLDGSNARPRTLSAATIRGELGAVAWNITGNVGTIRAASVDTNWSASVTGNVGSLRISGDLLGDVSAGAISTVAVGGNLRSSRLVVTNETPDRITALRTMQVRGAIGDSVVWATRGNIGTISAVSMTSSQVLAGTIDEGIAESINDFAYEARIARVSLKMGSNGEITFSDSSIQAHHLGSITVGSVAYDGSTKVVVADRIDRVAGWSSVGSFPILRTLVEPADSHDGSQLDGFEIRIL